MVNTQNNKESFAAGKSAAALMNINNAKSEYTNNTLRTPNGISVWWTHREMSLLSYSRILQMACAFSQSPKILSVHSWRWICCAMTKSFMIFSAMGLKESITLTFGNGKIELTENNSNYPYDTNGNWGIRNDKYWKSVEGGIPNYDKLYDKWIKQRRQGNSQHLPSTMKV